MLYPENLSEKLDFTSIMGEIIVLCKTASGKFLASKIRFTKEFDKIDRYFRQVSEYIHAKQEGAPATRELQDISPLLKLLKTSGFQLDTEEILNIRGYLHFSLEWKEFLKAEEIELPELKNIFSNINLDPSLLSKIDQVIAPDGSINDGASPELKKIRRDKESQQRKIRSVVQKKYNQLKSIGFVPDGASISVKNGRTVIPVLAEHKRKVSGYIQDESATGQTVFIEPSEMIDSVNLLQELESAERREINKILKNLTHLLHLDISEVQKVQPSVGIIDLISAKFEFLNKHQFNLPKLINDSRLKLRDAFHPLLLIANRKENKKTVSLSLNLDNEQRIVVISGPNAGGKSVSLKTIGLIQLMVQSGIPVPVGEDSEIGIFNDLFINIGDDQSIENDLSTYSSHLLHVHKAISYAGKQSLLLFDEFGSGTEPQMGGAIAQASLEKFVEKKCKGVITTHYTNIKEQAEKSEGLVNAAMAYDTELMEPLFELRVGKPGQSFAIEIAKKIGFNRSLLKRAENLIGKKLVALDKLISKTEQQKQELDQKEREFRTIQKEISGNKEKYEDLLANIREKEKDILKRATSEAEYLISSANKEIEKTIRHIKVSKAHKEETKKVRNKLGTVKDKIKQISEDVNKKKNSERSSSSSQKGADVNKPLIEGDFVRLEGQDKSGQIVKIKGKNAEVRVGEMTMRVKIDKLHRSQDLPDHSKKSGFSKPVFDRTGKRAMFQTELSIRGMRAEVAIQEIDKFLDEALLAGAAEVRILHGKGEGVLKNITHNMLRKYKHVESFYHEHADRGGEGITIVVLK